MAQPVGEIALRVPGTKRHRLPDGRGSVTHSFRERRCLCHNGDSNFIEWRQIQELQAKDLSD